MAKGTVLLHGPEHWGKLEMHLSVTLGESDLLAFRGEKPLGASREGQPVWERTTATPGIHPVTAVLMWMGCELGDEGMSEHDNLKNRYLLLHDSGLGSYGITNKYLRTLQNVMAALKY